MITLVSINALVIFLDRLLDGFFAHLFDRHSQAGQALDIVENRFSLFQDDFFLVFLIEQLIVNPDLKALFTCTGKMIPRPGK
jgi:hypothetical protein